VAQSAIGEPSYPFILQSKTCLPFHQLRHIVEKIRVEDHHHVFAEQRGNPQKQRSNLNDGLIFTPEKQPYIQDPSRPILKWKWYEHNTVDFVVKDEGKNELSLLTGLKNGSEHLFATAPAPDNWDALKLESGPSSVFEVGYDKAKGSWKILHPRKDKNRPNFITVAVSTMEALIQDITVDELLKTVAPKHKQQFEAYPCFSAK